MSNELKGYDEHIVRDEDGNVISRWGIKIPYGNKSSYNTLINLDVLRGIYWDIYHDRWLRIRFYGLTKLKGGLGDLTSPSNKLRKRKVYAIKISPSYKEETLRNIKSAIDMIVGKRQYEDIIEKLKETELDFDYYLIRKVTPEGKEKFLIKRNMPTKYKPKMYFKLSNIKIVKYKKAYKEYRKRYRELIKRIYERRKDLSSLRS